MSDPLDITDIKSYLFAHVETPSFDTPFPILRGKTYDGLTDDQAFQLVVAMLAAEETAEIIGASLKRTAMISQQPTVLPSAVTTTDGIIKRELMWVSRKYDAAELDSRSVSGSRQILSLTGPGKIIETILIADTMNIGMTLTVDGTELYGGSYSTLELITKADSRLAIYKDPTTLKYVIKASNIGFIDSFIFSATTPGTPDVITFDTIRVNYDLLVNV